MRLLDLNPNLTPITKDVMEAGTLYRRPTGDYQLSFRCPACNNGGIIVADLTLGEPHDNPRRWHMEGDLSNLTVTPSIGNEGNFHGSRRPACTFHGHVTNGEVSFPGHP